jgi:hypothetical protein
MNLLLPGGMGGDYGQGSHGLTPNATEDDLIEALAALERGDVEYVILEDETKLFLQAAGDAASGYILEHNNPHDDSMMMRAAGNVSAAQLTGALTAFLNRDPSWRTMFTWARITY